MLFAYCLLITAVINTAVLRTQAKSSSVAMYRLYNQNSGEHFYTAKEKEKNALVSYGWKYEGIGWYAPEKSSTPVHRLYNSRSGDHHYTMKEKERDALVSYGWKYEGIGWYSDDNEEVPLYREYNPNMTSCNHNYTTNLKEHEALTSKLGWQNEGIGWYGLKNSSEETPADTEESFSPEDILYKLTEYNTSKDEEFKDIRAAGIITNNSPFKILELTIKFDLKDGRDPKKVYKEIVGGFATEELEKESLNGLTGMKACLEANTIINSDETSVPFGVNSVGVYDTEGENNYTGIIYAYHLEDFKTFASGMTGKYLTSKGEIHMFDCEYSQKEKKWTTVFDMPEQGGWAEWNSGDYPAVPEFETKDFIVDSSPGYFNAKAYNVDKAFADAYLKKLMASDLKPKAVDTYTVDSMGFYRTEHKKFTSGELTIYYDYCPDLKVLRIIIIG